MGCRELSRVEEIGHAHKSSRKEERWRGTGYGNDYTRGIAKRRSHICGNVVSSLWYHLDLMLLTLKRRKMLITVCRFDDSIQWLYLQRFILSSSTTKILFSIMPINSDNVLHKMQGQMTNTTHVCLWQNKHEYRNRFHTNHRNVPQHTKEHRKRLSYNCKSHTPSCFFYKYDRMCCKRWGSFARALHKMFGIPSALMAANARKIAILRTE